MSLVFSGSTSAKVTVSAATELNNLTAGTVLVWFYPTRSGAALTRIYQKALGASGKLLDGTYVSSAHRISLEQARATTPCRATAAESAISVWGLDKWICVGAVFDTAGANGDQRLFFGDLATAATEASAYTSQQVGTGALADDSAADLIIGNKSNNNSNFGGSLGVLAFVNRVLTVGEIIDWQFNPRHISGCVAFYRLGDNGTSTQPDLSGNGNNGTVASATQGANPPLRRWFRAGGLGVPYAVVASGDIAGASAGVATTAGALTGTGALGGASDGIATAVADLDGDAAASGSAAGVASATGALTGDATLAGAADGAATAAADLDGDGALSGSSAGAATATGSLDQPGTVSGTASGAATAAGALTGDGALGGAAAGGGGGSGSLGGDLPGSGAAAGAATAAGDLDGDGALAGTGAGAGTAAGAMVGTGALSGASAGAASTSGALSQAGGFAVGSTNRSAPRYRITNYSGSRVLVANRSGARHILTDRSEHDA